MNTRAYIIILLFCTTFVPAVSAQELVQVSRWSIDMARQDAAQAIKNNTLFLYSSGGIVCYPKADSRYKEFIKLLPVETLACGCSILDIGKELAQMEYALFFNNTVLDYVSKNTDSAIKQLNLPHGGFVSYINSTEEKTNKTGMPIIGTNN
ncbi:MAG: hypothetical protein COB26_10240 [Piscirickettsiaceae bacterium]|nr:MAG: hypothetical protein COB26_10240 [Piscirickettsiaceae bacterium]